MSSRVVIYAAVTLAASDLENHSCSDPRSQSQVAVKYVERVNEFLGTKPSSDSRPRFVYYQYGLSGAGV